MKNQLIREGSRVTILIQGIVTGECAPDAGDLYVRAPEDGKYSVGKRYAREQIAMMLPPIFEPDTAVWNRAMSEEGVVLLYDEDAKSYVVRVGETLAIWGDDEDVILAEDRWAHLESPAEPEAAPAPPPHPAAPCAECGLVGDHKDDCSEAMPF